MDWNRNIFKLFKMYHSCDKIVFSRRKCYSHCFTLFFVRFKLHYVLRVCNAAYFLIKKDIACRKSVVEHTSFKYPKIYRIDEEQRSPPYMHRSPHYMHRLVFWSYNSCYFFTTFPFLKYFNVFRKDHSFKSDRDFRRIEKKTQGIWHHIPEQ